MLVNPLIQQQAGVSPNFMRSAMTAMGVQEDEVVRRACDNIVDCFVPFSWGIPECGWRKNCPTHSFGQVLEYVRVP